MTTPWIIFIVSQTIAFVGTLVTLTWRGANLVNELKQENLTLNNELKSLKEQYGLIQKVAEESLAKIEDRMEKVEDKISETVLAVNELKVLVKVLIDKRNG